MIINKPVIKIEGDKVEVSSVIEFLDKKHKLWYKADKKFAKYLNEDIDHFVVALLPMAMALNEDIEAKGNISPLLHYNISIYEGYFNFFFEDKMKKINVTAQKYEKSGKQTGKVLSAFSGGIDSFYTLLKNIKNKENRGYEITDILFIEGFDNYLKGSEKHFKQINEEYIILAKHFNINLITISTNIRDIIDPYLDWGMLSHGAVLASCGLILKKYASKFYMPSGFDYSFPIPWTSSPVVDHLLSTENFEIINHGAESKRIEKLEYISKYPIAQNHLRVCWAQASGPKNCENCEKCIRTIISLRLVGKLYNFKTFKTRIKDKDLIKKWRIRDKVSRHFALELMDYAKDKGEKNLYWYIKKQIAINDLKNSIEKTTLQPLYNSSHKAKKKYPAYKYIISKIKR